MPIILLMCVLTLIRVSLRTSGNKNVALKDQLARSLIHVGEMLVDMEHKIEREREQLSQIDRNLNQEEPHQVKQPLLSNSDYQDVTPIWWPSSSTNSTGQHMDAVTTDTAIPGQYDNITTQGGITIKTTPTLFPRPETKSTFATFPPKIQDSPFVADMKKNMEINHYGYFITSAERFSELIHDKLENDGYPVVRHMVDLFKTHKNNGTFDDLGVDLLFGATIKIIWFENLSPARIKQQAGVLHYMLKLMNDTMTPVFLDLLTFYDNMFTKEQGQILLESLEPLAYYPDGNTTFESVAKGIFDAIIAPYIASKGTRTHKRLVQHIFKVVHEADPYFRAQTMSSLVNNDTDANHSTKDHSQSAFPERRSINYKKIVKHFLVKHPKLFRKIKRQYKHDKENEHHRFSHTRKRHNNYRKSRGAYQRHKRLYNREQTRERGYTESSYEPENEEIEANYSGSGAYYSEHSTGYQQKNIHKVQRAKQWNLLKGTRSTTNPTQDYPQYLKQLAIRFLRNKQQRQNFYSNRRFNTPSSEEDICNHSQNLQDSVENGLLHKIREASSYSDEEYQLRNNLYDALRHGNRTFVSFRKSDGDVNNKQKLRAFSSETDEEWVLKNNIYKVFEQEKK